MIIVQEIRDNNKNRKTENFMKNITHGRISETTLCHVTNNILSKAMFATRNNNFSNHESMYDMY